MKKKIIAAALAAAAAVSLMGCGNELSNEYVIVKQYKGLEVPQAQAAAGVTEEEIEQAIQVNLQRTAQQNPVTDRAAESGDWVNIDYAGTVDGVAFDGGTAQAQDLLLGSGSFIGASGEYEGFEDQIIGHKTGEEFDITVQFPENYSPDMAGKVADFHIVLNEIYVEDIPELTDEWVLANSEGAKTVDEYREEIRSQIEENNDMQAESELTEALWGALMENVEIKKYPEAAVDEHIEQTKEQYVQMAELYGTTLEDMITTQFMMTEEDFDEILRESAQEAAAFDEAVKLIADKEKLNLSDAEYEEKIAGYAEEYGFEVEEYKEQMGEERLKNTILRETVMRYLIDECVQVEQSSAE
ncbi:MAG TPA: trigger factor [Candidatus Mediterraneibacter merdavium]|nr:trigger factor [Candidatus Mediterraneibacter merdavium]